MRYSTAAQLSLLLGSAHALTEVSIEKRTDRQWGVALPPQLVHKRDSSGTDSTNIFSILTYSTGGAYYANVTVGTPPQNQVVILDTGSSDLYFDASTAPACQSTTASNSCRGGTFNPSNSNTYKIVSANGFKTAFGDGSTASGPYSTDTLGIGSWSIANVQFGVASKVNSTTGYAVGLMGIGYSLLEATASSGSVYPNVPEILKDAGVIQSRLYSVYLNDVGANSGSILFGGVDTSKYTGTMATLNLIPAKNQQTIYQFVSTVTDFSTNVNGKSSSIISGGKDGISAYSSSNAALPVLLDTGSSAWTVPSSVYNAVVKQFSYVDDSGFCSCSHRTSGDSLTLTFGGKVQITVPAYEFIVPVYDPETDQPVAYDNQGNLACAFMLSPPQGSSSQGFLTLGDAVLRSMYVVFDLDNAQVSLAQAAVNSSSSPNIVKVGSSGVAGAVSGVSSISPNSYTIAPQVRATQTFIASTIATPVGTATGIDAVPTDARPIGGIVGGSSSGSSGSSQSSSKAAAAGLVVPAFYWPGLASLAWMAIMTIGGAALVL